MAWSSGIQSYSWHIMITHCSLDVQKRLCRCMNGYKEPCNKCQRLMTKNSFTPLHTNLVFLWRTQNPPVRLPSPIVQAGEEQLQWRSTGVFSGSSIVQRTCTYNNQSGNCSPRWPFADLKTRNKLLPWEGRHDRRKSDMGCEGAGCRWIVDYDGGASCWSRLCEFRFITNKAEFNQSCVTNLSRWWWT